MPSPPPKWVTALGGFVPDLSEAEKPKPDPIEAAAGLGAALGYWLPTGINRAKAATRRLAKAVR